MGDLSQNFSLVEFACPHCGVAEVEDRLIQGLQHLRNGTGPIAVSSGYRCPTHNESDAVGGSPDSTHPKGTGADVVIARLDVVEMYEAALLVPEFRLGGIGIYDGGFIHVDVRSGRTRWARIAGVYRPIGAALLEAI